MKTLQIDIPVIVGSNGKWCSNGWATKEGEEPDWSVMADMLEGDDGKYPCTERRYIVKALVYVPDELEVVDGAVLSAERY